MENDDVDAFQASGVVLWYVYENDRLPDVASGISDLADTLEKMLLDGIELYKSSVVVPEDVADVINALEGGIQADIWYDANDYGDGDKAKTIEKTQNAMQIAVGQLKTFSALVQKDVVVGPWDSKYYNTSDEDKPLKHTIRLADQRVSNGQMYIDVRDNDLNENVLSVSIEIDTKGRPTAILHFDDNQVAAVFRKVADRNFLMDPETGIQVTRVAHGQFHITGDK